MKRFTALVLFLLLSLTALTGAPAMGEDMADSKTYTCGNYQYVILDDGTAEIVDYQREERSEYISLTIPSELDGVQVSSIGFQCFNGSDRISSIVIPDSVRRIGSQAFNHLWYLSRVTIPDSVTEIGENPFIECIALKEIIISPNHPVLAMKDHLLYAWPDQRLICCLLTYHDNQIIIPDGTRSIDSLAFSFDETLTTVSIPGSVTTISKFTFLAVFNLVNVSLGEGIEQIGPLAFFGCTNLTDITIPASVTFIDDDAFAMNSHGSSDTSEARYITNPDLTLTVVPGSYAEQYAIDHGIKYVYAE